MPEQSQAFHVDARANDMDKLVALSRFYGADPEFALAGGGNTSVKIGSAIAVKASGFFLRDIDRSGFVTLDRAALARILETDFPQDPARREAEFKNAILAARVDSCSGLRPSVECALHNLLPAKFVAHTHSTWANMLCCSTSGEAVCGELFGDEVLWVPYVDPGYVLARTLRSLLADYRKRTGRDVPRAVLMQSHGLIVASDDPSGIVEHTQRIVSTIRQRVESSPAGAPPAGAGQQDVELAMTIAPLLRGFLSTSDRLKLVTFDNSEPARMLAMSPAGRDMAAGGPLTPDQIVYCGSYPMWFARKEAASVAPIPSKLSEAVNRHRSERGLAPQIVIVEGLGLFAAGEDFAAAENARTVQLDAAKVMSGASRLGGVRYLAKRDREFIEGWELETHRRAIASASKSRGRAAGLVALVTGAAQGFGFEIASRLAEDGAHVVIADVSEQGARKASDTLAGRVPAGRVFALMMDVTRGESVLSAVRQAVRRFGGFDVVISNAGVLRAGSVKTQSESEFEFVTDVNYKGYFNCVQAVAPVMALEHAARPDHWSDIIQINSKSGFTGSNRNAAYAGSKFGGVGLTQSFALELVEDGIKVNAICPGNFFDGPLWSDPDNGLFAQYLKSGKVPGARTTEDVRRFYESKVPMGRGCTAGDLMTAVYYLIEQKYETGQALPVTGGQIMK